MATVTKLKAAVNNKNLPILDANGNLQNYCVGRYLNKMSELGVNLDSAEILALNSFIQNGIDNGWINDILYFLPFVGRQTNLLSGMVPLIDDIADYELGGDSVSEKLFTFNSGKIVSAGNVENNTSAYYQLPIKNTDMRNGLSVFFNKTANTNDRGGYLVSTHVGDNVINAIRKKSTDNVFQSVFRESDSQASPSVYDIVGSNYNSGEQIGVFVARYLNTDNEYKLKRYTIKKGSTSPTSNIMNGNESSSVFSTTPLNMNIDSHIMVLNTTFNCMAFINPLSINEAKIYSFNQAVFALTTALGR